MRRDFRELLEGGSASGWRVCVGLDSDPARIPNCISGEPAARQLTFSSDVIEATSETAAAFKLNSAFHEALGADGIDAMVHTVAFCHQVAPEVPVILDFKRGDIGTTIKGYATFAYDVVQADAVTVHPYLGSLVTTPSLIDRKGKGAFVLCRTSNPGAGEFQDLQVVTHDGSIRPLYEVVALSVQGRWNMVGYCGLVVGATYPAELQRIRTLVLDLPLLIPGVGAQGGDVRQVGQVAYSPGAPCTVNSSRGVVFASARRDYAEAVANAATELHNMLNHS